MSKFFLVMTNVSTTVALVTAIVFYVGILCKQQLFTNIDVFNACNNQIKACRVLSVIFAVLYWFLVSGLPTVECLECYRSMADACCRLGYIWIGFGFVNIVISIIFGILKKGKDALDIMGKLRGSSFVMGAIFLLMVFILKVD